MLLGIVIILVLGDIPQIFAQESDSDEFTLEEITVTAQKRAENQQKVAIPMDVISGEQLAETGKMNVDEILSGLSNVIINYSQDGMRVGIRGLQETDGLMNNVHISNPTVGVNLDGAFSSSSSAGQNLFDIERVEVLYGPQSTMYGSNTPGGIVNVVTAAPKTDRYSASAQLEVGNYDLFNGQAMFNAPVVKDKLAMRASIGIQKRGTYLSGATNKTAENTKSARLKTLFQPNDKLSMTLTGYGTNKDNGGMYQNSVVPFTYQDKVSNPWTYATGGMPSAPNNGSQRSLGAQADIRWETGIGSLSIVPSYNTTHSTDQGLMSVSQGMGPLAPPPTWQYIYNRVSHRQTGFEARLVSSKDSPIKWILGVMYNDLLERQLSKNISQADGSVTYSDFWYTDKNKAVYGNITYPFSETFRGTAGIRYSSDRTQSLGGMFGLSNAPAYNKPDYKLGLEYDMAKNSMFYANWATSYRENAFRTGIPPEKDKTYTAGIKSRLFENKVQLNASAYYYDYKYVQVQVDGMRGNSTVNEKDITDPYGNPINLNPTTAQVPIPGDWKNTNGEQDNTSGDDELITIPGDPADQLQNADFRTIGLDASVDWIITSKDKLDVAFTYLDSKWKKFKIFTWLHYTQAYMTAHGLTGDDSVITGIDGTDLSGMVKTYSPKITITLGYDHNFDLWTYGILVPHVDLLYKSHYIMSTQASNYPYDYQESYYLINANATFTHSSGAWSVNAYIKNAMEYAAKTMYMMGSMSITDPRTYGAVLSVKF